MDKTFRITLNKKLGNRSGETIAETLVALLISALALTMLAASISAASHMVTLSKEKLEKYYNANNLIIKMEGTTVSDAETQEIIYGPSTNIDIKSNDNKLTISKNAILYVNKAFPDPEKEVVSYRIYTP